MSLIEEQLARLRRGHDERKVRFGLVSAETHVSEAAHDGAPGVLEIDTARRDELHIAAATLEGVRAIITQFNFAEEPLQSFLEILFISALALRASDVHCEPEESSIRIRYRIDGILHEGGALPHAFFETLVARVKLLAKLKLNADRPQDGRLSLRVGDMSVDIR